MMQNDDVKNYDVDTSNLDKIMLVKTVRLFVILERMKILFTTISEITFQGEEIVHYTPNRGSNSRILF